MTQAPDAVGRWIDAVVARHAAPFSTSELLRAIRALSVRYVERRGALATRSPLDSAGKRAAFAGFYGPLHYLTTVSLLDQLGPAWLSGVDTIVDLGCGTGVVGAAAARVLGSRAAIVGVDRHAWTLSEANWNWRQLRVRGRTRRGDLVAAADALRRDRAREPGRLLVTLGWSVNELPAEARSQLLETLVALLTRNARLLVVEPIGSAATPWWPAWVDALAPRTGREDRWSLEAALPARLAALDAEAGFARRVLSAKTLSGPW